MNQQKGGKEKVNCCDNQYEVKIDFNFKLGEGGYAKVYRGSLYQKKDGDEIVIPIAVKRTIIKKNLLANQKQSLINLTNQEIQILKQAIHPNIVKFYGSCHHKHLNEEFIDIYLELCECNLKEYITSMSYFSESVVLDIFCKIVQVTQYLCQLRIMSKNQQYYIGIYHRDLNMKNILVKGHTLKLTDFGLAKPKPKDSIIEISTRRGTPIYMSPENFQKQQYDLEKNDVWSMGVLLYQLLYGYTEFKPQEAHESKLKFPNSKHPQLQELLQNHMLCEESCRYNFTQLSQHLNSIYYNNLDNQLYTIEDTFQVRLNVLQELYQVRFNEYRELYNSIQTEIKQHSKQEYVGYVQLLILMQTLVFESFYGFYQSKQSQYVDRYVTSNLQENDSSLHELILQMKEQIDEHLEDYSKNYQQLNIDYYLEPLGYLYLLNQLFKQISQLKLNSNKFQENSQIPQQFKQFMEWRKRKIMYKEEIKRILQTQYKKIEKKHDFFVENEFLKLRKRNSNIFLIELFKY